ncbi:recombination-associated protein RdgC [Pseudodesulfovibrio sp. zrk46]|uniref:recombination-associated protein RdgC n=1 Tax=Pseudodesulfovibrio sp. zrk46 TaxID=2725288 RepID=UPI001448F2A1|nr:recombination-associated protein RdgC [Pseudodesulfovibrio sp. zrk46]QJB58025.1 recombination-associated protein RdgC [Pseudodesulfovibrio sp. zrk46]
MSILSASLGLTRYRIIEDVPQDLLAQVPEKLQQFAFVDIDATADERSFGWTNMDDMLDINWTQSPPEKAEYFTFAMRLDTRRIPPAVLKKHYTIALNKELTQNKEQGKNFVSRDRKRELKEQVTLRLRARTFPIPAVFDIIWNPSNNRIYLTTTNSKVRALFEDYFALTFDLHLEPLTPFFMAMDILGEEAAPRLEGLEPTIFV